MEEIHPVRMLTVSQLKGVKKVPHLQEKPKEGTRLREVYDLFVSNPGKPVEYTITRKDNRIVDQLRLFWGLDVRQLKKGDSRIDRPSIWILAAYWDGKKYVDCCDPNDPLIIRIRRSDYFRQRWDRD